VVLCFLQCRILGIVTSCDVSYLPMVISLKNKVYITLIVVVVFCSAFVLQRSLVGHEQYYIKHSESLYQAVSDNLAVDLVESLSSESEFEATTRLLMLDRYEFVEYAVVIDHKGVNFAQYISPNYASEKINFKQDLYKMLGDKVSLSNNGHQLLLNNEIGDAGYTLGRLLISIDLATPLAQSRSAMLEDTLTVVTFFVVIVGAILFWMNRTFFRPLSNLTEFAASIKGSDNLKLRTDIDGDQEVRELSAGINDMLTRVENESKNNLARYRLLQLQKDRLRNLVNYDSLTQLPNRKFFLEALHGELSRAKRHDGNCILLFLDLDHFKDINDSLGHESGDVFLVKVANVIQEQLRDGDLLGRIGGDEFLVLIADVDVDAVDVAVAVSERILRALKKPITIKGWDFNTGVSIGIVDAITSEYDSEVMIKNADVAMYHAKNNGRNNYAMFQNHIQQENLRKIKVANALSKALDNNEFGILYQPKVDSNQEVVGLEALIRWNSPSQGVISPAEFIPVAEGSGKINELTRWVIKHTFSDLNDIFISVSRDVRVSINLSVHDVKDINLIDFINEQAKVHHVNPSNIEFEVTESAYLDNFEKAQYFLDQLKSLGYTIALDDFGTGYSSMSYLTQIQVDTLKIDRQFVTNLQSSLKDKMIVEAIVDLALKLKMHVCAEGVETEYQRNLLMEIGCTTIQGYFYSKPRALEELGETRRSIKEKNNPMTQVV